MKHHKTASVERH